MLFTCRDTRAGGHVYVLLFQRKILLYICNYNKILIYIVTIIRDFPLTYRNYRIDDNIFNN